MFVIDIYPSKN